MALDGRGQDAGRALGGEGIEDDRLGYDDWLDGDAERPQVHAEVDDQLFGRGTSTCTMCWMSGSSKWLLIRQ